jgi:glycosyltransferase involved in cell wall biosynthesis
MRGDKEIEDDPYIPGVVIDVTKQLPANALPPRSILVLLSNAELGGIGVQARDQASYLSRLEIASGLLILNRYGLTSEQLAWYSAVVSTEVVPDYIDVRSGILRIHRYVGYFRSRPERIFHFHAFSQEYINWHAVLAARLAGKLVVATLHHTVGWVRKRLDPGFIFQRLAWRFADRLIVTTRSGKELVEQKAPKGKTDVVPCIIPDVGNSTPRDKARADLQIADDEFLVVVVSRLIPSKGIIDLVNAVRALGNHLDIRLLIAGDGPCRDELSELINDDQRIRLLGRVQDKNGICAAADLFALPSYEEGFGMVYAEAARHGVPSIASDLPQVREVVVDGETGWLVPPGNVERLRNTIEWAYRHREECVSRGQNAKSYCRRFDPEVVMARQIRIYDDLLKGI